MKRLLFLFFILQLSLASAQVLETIEASDLSFIDGSQNIQANIVDDGYKIQFGEDGAVNVGGRNFLNVEEGSFLSTDKNGSIIGANLTASGSASWIIDNKTYNVPAGTKLVYSNGTVKLDLPKNSSLSIDSPEGKFAISNNLEDRLNINGSTLSGKNFQIDDLTFSGVSNRDNCIVERRSSHEYIIKQGGKVSTEKTRFLSVSGDLVLTKVETHPGFGTDSQQNRVWLSPTSSDYAARAGQDGRMEIQDIQRKFNTRIQSGASTSMEERSLVDYFEIGTHQSGSAQMFNEDRLMIQSGATGTFIGLQTRSTSFKPLNVIINQGVGVIINSEGDQFAAGAGCVLRHSSGFEINAGFRQEILNRAIENENAAGIAFANLAYSF